MMQNLRKATMSTVTMWSGRCWVRDGVLSNGRSLINMFVDIFARYFKRNKFNIVARKPKRIVFPFFTKMHKSDKKQSSTHLLNELNKLRTQQKYLEATQTVLKPSSHSPAELNDINELECLKIEQDLNLVTLEDRLKHDTFRLRESIQNVHCEMLKRQRAVQIQRQTIPRTNPSN